MISRCAGPLRSLRAAEQRELLWRRAAPLLTPLRATCATIKPVHERQVNSDRKASIEGCAPAGIRDAARPEPVTGYGLFAAAHHAQMALIASTTMATASAIASQMCPSLSQQGMFPLPVCS